MSYLIRKITKSKWDQHKTELIHGMPLAMIHSEFKSDNSTLSLWYAENEEQILDAIMILSLNQENIETVDICLIPFDLMNSRFNLIKINGRTVIDAYIDRHYDFLHVTYSTLGEFANIILDSFQDSRVIRLTGPKILNELARRALDNEYDINLTKDGVKKKVESQIDKNIKTKTIVKKEDYIQIIKKELGTSKAS